MSTQPEPSRPRRYDFEAVPSFENPDVGYAVAALDEASERLYDLLRGLDSAVMDYVPDATSLSITRLVRHMIWGELGSIGRAVGVDPPDDLVSVVEDGSLGRFDRPPEKGIRAEELVDLGRKIRGEFTKPELSTVKDFDSPVTVLPPNGKGPSSVRQVLMHQVWHWTYHTAHVGLIRLLAGSDYHWAF